jgi:trimethylamine--corrinoid protein Co-methyltransferase
VLDSEAIASAQRLLAGIFIPEGTLALDTFAQTGLEGEFLKLRETRALFKKEQHLPSEVIDRGSLQAWQESGARDAFSRASDRVEELVCSYQQPALAKNTLQAFDQILKTING